MTLVRDAVPEYIELLAQAKQFSDILKGLAALATRLEFSDEERTLIAQSASASSRLLKNLECRLDDYESLGTSRPGLAQKLTWRRTILPDFTARLTAQLTMLHAIYFSLSQTSLVAGQTEILNALNTLKEKIKTGSSKLTSISSLSGDEHDKDHDQSDWIAITSELELLGITATMANAHKDLIVKYFESAVAFGELSGDLASDTGSTGGKAVAGQTTPDKVEAWLAFQGSLGSRSVTECDSDPVAPAGNPIIKGYDSAAIAHRSHDVVKADQCKTSHDIEMGLLPTIRQNVLNTNDPGGGWTQYRQYQASINIGFKFWSGGDPHYDLKMMEDIFLNDLTAINDLSLAEVSFTSTVNHSQRLMYVRKILEQAERVLRNGFPIDAVNNRQSTRDTLVSEFLTHRAQNSGLPTDARAQKMIAETVKSTHRIAQMTEKMHEIAQKTRTESISMRIITLVTLFFLPGTFVAVRPAGLTSNTIADKNRLF